MRAEKAMADIGFPAMVLVFVGGGVGSVLRYAITKYSLHWFGAYPYGTLAANLLGALLAGIGAVLVYERHLVHPPYNDLLLAGFLGGLTTFSAMMLDTHRLAQHGMFGIAVIYLCVNIVLGLLLFSAAHYLARAV
jgi:CrcB protein